MLIRISLKYPDSNAGSSGLGKEVKGKTSAEGAVCFECLKIGWCEEFPEMESILETGDVGFRSGCRTRTRDAKRETLEG